MSKREYRSEYMGCRWDGLEELIKQLNVFCNDGWLADTHRIDGGVNYGGWTIYRKTVMLSQPLLERSINVGEVYSILNRVIEPGTEQSRAFDAAIKATVRQEGDE